MPAIFDWGLNTHGSNIWLGIKNVYKLNLTMYLNIKKKKIQKKYNI